MLKQIRASAIAPALALLPARMSGRRAEQMLLTVGLQESRLEHRRQLGNGPARGLWQFEKGGGVRGVLEFHTTKALARSVCEARGVAPTADAVHAAMEHDDVLAAAFARLLLWTDPAPLPAVGEVQQAWALYVRTWRPGKPHRHTWDGFYAQAMEELA
ncbi:hypothetical protein RRX38_08760 [Pseudomonas sp. DTU_2021_1001937_2_SI_NGA_ILE_001]|uniref:hypothetical protein n=1 Tax=Pseudomonas sp. DTU_2021_1001937_2_SI_NGA_ILE_001 TaxID=3077589 RepID=UPI0028FC3093|nr:hypothetical protein [Pseudomonas sp. DTU_2021_1001937_2_SI_NGA_ILE_001]WNW11240.1 hypothetical protein RRX38_08760 [Pseudomonas sp. DTU_2021_1001937_2_SI_NGA_ILE_001]